MALRDISVASSYSNHWRIGACWRGYLGWTVYRVLQLPCTWISMVINRPYGVIILTRRWDALILTVRCRSRMPKVSSLPTFGDRWLTITLHSMSTSRQFSPTVLATARQFV